MNQNNTNFIEYSDGDNKKPLAKQSDDDSDVVYIGSNCVKSDDSEVIATTTDPIKTKLTSPHVAAIVTLYAVASTSVFTSTSTDDSVGIISAKPIYSTVPSYCSPRLSTEVRVCLSKSRS